MARKSVTHVQSALEQLGGFASAQEIFQAMLKHGTRIGLTTVYRCLQTLANENMVDLLRREDGEAMYRLCGNDHHHHLVCKKCGTTVEIEGGAIEKWAKSIGAAHGFREIGHTAELFGTCSRC